MIHSTCWLGVFIGEEEARGKGFGKEAVKLIIDYAFNTLNFRKVSLEVVNTNKHAIEVYKNFGFRIEGNLKDHVLINGKYGNSILMSLVKK